MELKVLNLYCGIGGNRKLWQDVDVTAVEIDPEIAKIYQDYFPDDKVIVGDAHQYLLDHYKEFDFIWGSPPCQSHSMLNRILAATGGRDPIYPDMKLYQEILFLQSWFKGKWVIENTKPYHLQLIPETALIDRHPFWANFKIGNWMLDVKLNVLGNTNIEMEEHIGISLKGFSVKNRKDQLLKNCVDPKLGLYILNCARNIITKQNVNQTALWN